MSEAPKWSEGNWNPFAGLASSASSIRNNSAIRAQHGFGSSMKLKDALKLNEQHHGHVMDHLKTSYDLETKFQTHLSGLEEQKAQGTHNRALELHGAIQKASEGNTAINISFPEGGSVSYTRKARKTKLAAPTPEAPATETPAETVGKSWSETPVGAKSLPITSKASAAPSQTGGLVSRDPKTGRAVSMKSAEVKPSKKSSKKSATVAGASVARDPKTGRAIRIKK